MSKKTLAAAALGLAPWPSVILARGRLQVPLFTNMGSLHGWFVDLADYCPGKPEDAERVKRLLNLAELLAAMDQTGAAATASGLLGPEQTKALEKAYKMIDTMLGGVELVLMRAFEGMTTH